MSVCQDNVLYASDFIMALSTSRNTTQGAIYWSQFTKLVEAAFESKLKLAQNVGVLQASFVQAKPQMCRCSTVDQWVDTRGASSKGPCVLNTYCSETWKDERVTLPLLVWLPMRYIEVTWQHAERRVHGHCSAAVDTRWIA